MPHTPSHQPLTERQKNIVNPGASSLDTPERKGAGYDYTTTRARWIIQGIQDGFLNFGLFPPDGASLSGVDFEVNSITSADLLAYAALYPQNAKYNAGTGQLVILSQQESALNLRGIVLGLVSQGPYEITGYISPTTPEALLPQNQGVINLPQKEAESLPWPEIAETEAQLKAQLVALPFPSSTTRILSIRKSFGNPQTSLLGPPTELITDQQKVPLNRQQPNIDIYDWRNNVSPGQHGQAIYYNPNDQRYYFTKRTQDLEARTYDKTSEEYDHNKSEAINIGVQEILRFIRKYTVANSDHIKNQLDLQEQPVVHFASYLDPRPSSRWVYAVAVHKTYLDDLRYAPGAEPGQDEELSQWEKAARLATKAQNPQNKHAVFQMSQLKSTLNHTISVLRAYNSTMASAGVDASMVSGVELGQEASKLESFYDHLVDFLTYNQVEIDPDEDNVEFVFSERMELLYVVYNGYVYALGCGSPLFVRSEDTSSPSTSQLVVNMFPTSTPSTFGYVFRSSNIKAEYQNKEQHSWPSWVEFIESNNYPAPAIYPADADKKTRQALGSKIDVAALGFTRETIFERLDKVIDPSRVIDTRTPKITRKEFFSEVNSAMGSCSTAQAQFAQDVFKLMRILNSQKNTIPLINFAINQIKDKLLDDELAKAAITDAQGYANNPQRFIREVEARVNAEISCIIDLLGSRLEDQWLKPAGVPPRTARMVRQAATPPAGLNFWKGRPKKKSFWALWREQLEKLALVFIKQLMLGVLQDLLSAALGCGPEDDPDFLENPIKNRDYGLSDLNAIISYNELDIVPIAKNLGMTNKEVHYTTDPNDNTKVTRTLLTEPPKLNQLMQLNSDVSAIVTPTEMSRLLEGTAGRHLLAAINEMINGGEVNQVGLERKHPVPAAHHDPINIARFQESYKSGDVRYASLGLDESVIEAYFAEIGNQLGPFVTPLIERGPHDTTPAEAYCLAQGITPPRTISEPTTAYPSAMQVQEQYDIAIGAKKAQIDTLCGMLDLELPNIQLELDNFLESLPGAGMYEELLRVIKWLSDLISKYTLDHIYDNDEDAQGVPRRAPSFQRTPLGLSLIQSVPEQHLSSSVAAFKYHMDGPNAGFYSVPCPYSTNETFESDVGQVYGKFYNDIAQIYVTDYDGERKLAATTQLADTNTIYRNQSYTLKNIRNEDGSFVDSQLPPYSDFANRFLTSWEINNFRKVLGANRSETSFEALAGFYFTESGRLRLPTFLEQLGKRSFIENKDPCITPQQRAIASAALSGLQARVITFMLNTSPLLRIYLGWNTPDIITLLSDYLVKQVKETITAQGLYGVYLQAMDSVDLVFGKPPENAPTWRFSPRAVREKIYLSPSMNDDTKLEEVVKEIFKSLLGSLSETAYSEANTNVFDNNRTLGWYMDSTNEWFMSLNLNDQVTEPQAAYIGTLDDAQKRQALLSYFPLPLLVAMDIIYFDAAIKPLEGYGKWEFETLRRYASADDSLLTAINDSFVTRFMDLVNRFPITVNDRTYYSLRAMKSDYQRLLSGQAIDKGENDFMKFYEGFEENYARPYFTAMSSIVNHWETATNLYLNDADQQAADWTEYDNGEYAAAMDTGMDDFGLNVYHILMVGARMEKADIVNDNFQQTTPETILPSHPAHPGDARNVPNLQSYWQRPSALMDFTPDNVFGAILYGWVDGNALLGPNVHNNVPSFDETEHPGDIPNVGSLNFVSVAPGSVHETNFKNSWTNLLDNVNDGTTLRTIIQTRTAEQRAHATRLKRQIDGHVNAAIDDLDEAMNTANAARLAMLKQFGRGNIPLVFPAGWRGGTDHDGRQSALGEGWHGYYGEDWRALIVRLPSQLYNDIVAQNSQDAQNLRAALIDLGENI